MERFRLTRKTTGYHGTKGKLEGAGFSCCTLELPWVSNRSGISCIPTGVYTCVYELSPRYKKKMYGVINVPDRSGIRIHSANYGGAVWMGFKSDLLGCIALGRGFTTDQNGQQIIYGSRDMISKFQAHTGGEKFILEIVGDFTPLEV